MRVTIDIPEELAGELGSDRNRLAAIITRGLRRGWSPGSKLRREVISFFAKRPEVEAILAFRPSAPIMERSRELLRRQQEGPLTPEEDSELDEMADVDRFVSLIKAEVLAETSGRA